MQVLVTGGAGFIGSHVCTELESLGHTPIVFDRHNRADRIFLGDIRDPHAVTEAVSHCDAVIHLAGVLGTQETVQNPRPAFDTNVMGGLNVLEAARFVKVPVVYIAVGNWWMDNPYSISKTATERLCRFYRHEHDLTVAVVRTMNAYGPGQTPCQPYGPSKVRKIVPAFICRALTGTPIEIYGDGTQTMDMIHVTDVARSLAVAVGENDDYDCGTGRPTTVNQIAQIVLDAVGDGTISYLPMRPGEPEHSVVLADPDELLCTPDIDLEDGIGETVDWYRDNWLPTYV